MLVHAFTCNPLTDFIYLFRHNLLLIFFILFSYFLRFYRNIYMDFLRLEYSLINAPMTFLHSRQIALVRCNGREESMQLVVVCRAAYMYNWCWLLLEAKSARSFVRMPPQNKGGQGVVEQSRGGNLIARQNVGKCVVFQLHVIVLLKTIWDYIRCTYTYTHI